MGSIPTASIFLFKSRQFLLVDSFTNFTYLAAVFSFEIFAKVAELGDALDLGSSPARGGGSTPPFRIRQSRFTCPKRGSLLLNG